ncbi:hypothetical protein BpHYR1_033463 [Brachionus plicatilis]|uniref:Uncharacterized protein n=1 Tax=Brachionus plicatilis TaxID=10195 RepID=A0A3M7ST28_BRAPC|nr:hypothetical protein BpHYR1_033463 [Brachionus plicatilis]
MINQMINSCRWWCSISIFLNFELWTIFTIKKNIAHGRGRNPNFKFTCQFFRVVSRGGKPFRFISSIHITGSINRFTNRTGSTSRFQIRTDIPFNRFRTGKK